MTIDICPTHSLVLIPTRSGTQLVCPNVNPVCEHYVRKVDMSPKVTIPVNASKEERAKVIEQAVKEKKKAGTPVAATPAEAASNKKAKDDERTKVRIAAKAVPAKAVKAQPVPEVVEEEAPKAPKPVKDANLLTVSDVARELGIDPKQARAKLRRDGSRAPDGRWPKMKRDSKEHTDIISFLQGEQDDQDESKPKASKNLAKKKAPAKDEPEEEVESDEEEDEE